MWYASAHNTMTALALSVRVTILLACLAANAATPARAGDVVERPVVFRTQTMGTWASLTILTADSSAVADAAYEALVVFHRVDSLMSNWTDRSDVARINRTAGSRAVRVHPEVADVVGFAQRVARESNGAFDITIEPLVRLWGFIGGPPRVPSPTDIEAALSHVGADKLVFDASEQTVRFTDPAVAIDLGGIAKGFGVDAASAVLRGRNVENALLDLSGNMVALGHGPSGAHWVVGIRDPAGRHDYVARVRLSGRAVATSGDYEQFVAADGTRYGHILDPRTGWSARGLQSVTVVAPDAMTADAWATALFVLGPEKARAIAAAREDLGVVLVEPSSGEKTPVWIENTLREDVALPPAILPSLDIHYF